MHLIPDGLGYFIRVKTIFTENEILCRTSMAQLVERLPGLTLRGSGGIIDPSFEPHQSSFSQFIQSWQK